MNDETAAAARNSGTSIRRILVALDATAESLAALNAAADLAMQLHAELFGLFVEDINLARLAALPIAREIDLAAGSIIEINHQTVERQFRLQREKARGALESAARSRRLNWSFRQLTSWAGISIR